ncbi:MAG: Pr6Pr family membrane protein [Parvularculaceae bacterium]
MNLSKTYAAIAALIAWAALILQFRIFVFDPAPPPAGVALANYFSYFTILTNILVALALSASALGKPDSFLNRPSVRAAIAVYIAVVAIVYHIILNSLWKPAGWYLVANILLHYVTPALFWIDWVLFAPKRGLKFSMPLTWIIFPALYSVEALARGALTDFYPYPFLDAGALGYMRVFLNIAVMVCVFELAGAGVIALSRVLPDR